MAINITLVVVALVAVALILTQFVGSSKSTVATDTTVTTAQPSTTSQLTAPSSVPTEKSFVYGVGLCPAEDGSSPVTKTFTQSPKLCIDPRKTFTALIETSKGSLTVTLDARKAPGATNNFVVLARYHYFDGTTCHRIIPGFVVQCGDPTATGTGGPGYTIRDELPKSGDYQIGSLAMANSGPNTSGSQFFVVSGSKGVALQPDFSLFGQVTGGLNDTLPALDKAGNPNNNGVPPLETVTIKQITITEA